MTDLRGDY